MTTIAPVGDAYRGASVQLDLPVLAAGAVVTVAARAHDEAVLVLLAGEVEWAGTRVTRADVFDAPRSGRLPAAGHRCRRAGHHPHRARARRHCRRAT